MKEDKNDNGFTLLELLIGVAILLIALAAINGLFSAGTSTFKYTMSQEHSQAKGREAFNKIIDVVRYKPSSVTSPLFTSPLTEGDSMAFVDSSTTPISYSINFDSATKSIIINAGGTQTKYAEGVAKSIKFTNKGNNQFTIELTLNDNEYSGSPDVVFKSTVQLYNM